MIKIAIIITSFVSLNFYLITISWIIALILLVKFNIMTSCKVTIEIIFNKKRKEKKVMVDLEY